jgi:hypothetical protein
MALTTNMGGVDRAIRVVVALGLLYVGLFDSGLVANQVVRCILVAFAIINLVTAMAGFCPLYHLANLSSVSRKDN